jgi:MFS transporter, SP family, galactose:H+ symporter
MFSLVLKRLIMILGGFQFGYAIGVMAGAILFIATQFSLTPEAQGWLVSAFLIGTFPGATCAGSLANAIGRKRGQQVVALLFLIGTLLLITATSIPQIFIGRLIQGLAAGAISIIGPLYIAEVSPAERRGTYIAWYQLAVTMGIFISYGVNLLFSSSASWTAMFAVALIPALLHGIGFFFLPDSRPTQEPTRTSWRAFLEPSIRTALIFTILINVFQQITGVNAIIYFAPSIFQACGFNTPATALIPPLFMGLINVSMTLVAMHGLDRFGRRPLLIFGISGMLLSLLGLVVAFLSPPSIMKWLGTFSIMLYTASFAVGLGPIPQLLGPELFPRKVRGLGASLGGMSNWLFNFAVVFTFMDMTTRLSHAGTFAIYALCAVFALYFVWKYLPETRGRHLD